MRRSVALFVVLCSLSARADTWTDPETGITWTYILKGDTAAILSAIEMFDSAGKNMRRLSGELLAHFRDLVVVQALGPNSKSLVATGEQLKTLVEEAKAVEPGRVFRICDQLAEMEDKLRYVLSVRTLIELTLIRASRIATTATIDELLKCVNGMRGESSPRPSPEVTEADSQRKLMDDDRLNNDILASLPGATITGIRKE